MIGGRLCGGGIRMNLGKRAGRGQIWLVRAFRRRSWKRICCCLLPVLFAAAIWLRGGILTQRIGAMADTLLKRGTTAWIEGFWYPGTGAWPAESQGGAFGEEEGISGWLAGFILRHSSYYKRLQDGGDNGIKGEADPSYRKYMENAGILEEYQSLWQTLAGSSVFSSGTGEQPANTREENHVIQEALGTEAGSRLLEGAEITGVRYMEEQLADYDFLMKHFYTVHPTAAAGRDLMKAETFLSKNFSLGKKEGNRPQILIYHTHSQEEFADYSQGNREATIVGVGDYLSELLKEKGYSVIHDKTVYDLRDGKLDRSKAYTYALEGITEILEKNPSIEVVIDLHRDGVSEDTHLVTEIDGKKTATVMFFNGTSETPDGPIDYLENPYRDDNLAFSFQMKLCADACYPGFTRNIYLKGLRYNLHVRPRSTLIEVGAQNNTYEEAKNAMEPLADILAMVLQ